METVMLITKPRKAGTATKISYDVLGGGSTAEGLKESIRGLEHYPAPSGRRALVDILALIDKHRLKVVQVMRDEEEGMEAWTFILQA